ncbi:hypothetical protein HPP92_014490 [Vanilla planifolia]|uniref:At1g68980-like TPR repeats domain-containing protein n=1 Tax=Vanilla planifolia TaxID=51239 RepID=A0A835UT65_VANPL|nr:hypothetical protein HPP92_014490 [Vanilla planifolia]
MRVFYLPCELGRRLSYIEGSSARVACLISFGHIRSWRHICNWHHELVSYQKLHLSSTSNYPSCTQSVLAVDSSSCVSTQRKLENALKNNLIDEAWAVFSSHKSLHCLPNQELVKKMVNLMTSTSSSHFLLRAYKLVLLLLDKRQDLIDHESLIRLALSLARNQKPVAATTILRTLLDKSKLFSLDILSTIFFHLVKSEVGSCLASTMLIEICELSLFQKSVTRNCKQLKLLNLSVTIFNLVLDSCSRYGSFLKAQVIIDLMSQIGVVADVNSIIIFSRIYEKIGQRDELVRLKVLVDGCQSMKFMRHYCQLFDSLLSLHFRYNDLDAAAELMLDLCSRSESFQCVDKLTTRSDGLRKPCLFYIGSVNLRSGHCIMVEPERLGNVLTVDLQVLSGLVHFSNGKLVPSVKALRRL